MHRFGALGHFRGRRASSILGDKYGQIPLNEKAAKASQQLYTTARARLPLPHAGDPDKAEGASLCTASHNPRSQRSSELRVIMCSPLPDVGCGL